MSLSSTAAVNASAQIGGEAGTGAKAGNVTIINTGSSILTKGDGSAGIYVQSLGGSGGSGGSASTIQLGGSGTASVNLAATIGGKAGSGGTSGNVSVTNSANIQTGLITKPAEIKNSKGELINWESEIVTGNYSYGIYAQSVGGGGGDGGSSLTAQVAAGKTAAVNGGVNIGGGAGSGNSAGNVTVSNTGTSIRTLGNFATGAQ